MAQYAITVIIPSTYVSGNVSNTTTTGSMVIGNLLGGVRPWNDTILVDLGTGPFPQYFYASPIANISNAFPYVFGLPYTPLPPYAIMPYPPQFIYSMINGTPTLSDAAFVATADYILKNYNTSGQVDSVTPCNPGGCNNVTDCQRAVDGCGWFQSYGFTPP